MGGAFFCCWSHVEKKSVNTFFGSVFACTQKHFSMQVNFHNGKVLMKCCRKRKMLQSSVLKLSGKHVPITKKERRKLALSVRKLNSLLKRKKIRFTKKKDVTKFNRRTLDCNIFRFRQHFIRTFPL